MEDGGWRIEAGLPFSILHPLSSILKIYLLVPEICLSF
jgi:hypothetical protein